MTIKRVAAAGGSAGRRRRLARAGCAVAVPLVLAACGGGGGAKPAPTASCPTGTPSAAASGSPSPAVCVGTETGGTGGTARAWHGTITATATLIYLRCTALCGPFTGTYTGTMSLTVGSSGAVTGHGQVSQSGCTLKNPATSISFGLRGTDDGRQFRLQIPPASFHLHGGRFRTGCGFGVGLLGPLPGRIQSSTSMVIPIGPAGTARAHWVVHSRVTHNILENTARYMVNLASG